MYRFSIWDASLHDQTTKTQTPPSATQDKRAGQPWLRIASLYALREGLLEAYGNLRLQKESLDDVTLSSGN